jgi:hypothetical protein
MKSVVVCEIQTTTQIYIILRSKQIVSEFCATLVFFAMTGYPHYFRFWRDTSNGSNDLIF